jgi:hypothetical protein
MLDSRDLAHAIAVDRMHARGCDFHAAKRRLAEIARAEKLVEMRSRGEVFTMLEDEIARADAETRLATARGAA